MLSARTLTNPWGHQHQILAVKAITTSVLLHAFVITFFAVIFVPPKTKSFPTFIFLGSILPSSDFKELYKIRSGATKKDISNHQELLKSANILTPSGQNNINKPVYLTEERNSGERRYSKETFLNVNDYEETNRKKLLRKIGIEPTVPRYKSLRTFRGIKN